MTLNITLRQVEAFLAVCEEQHFSRAAARLCVSPPWLSQTIKELERHVGVRLLERTTRSVVLTEAGTVFASLAGRALTDLGNAVATTQSFARPGTQNLSLGYTIGAGLDILPRLVRTFAAQYPEVHVTTVEFDFADPSAGLRDRQVVAAVVRPPIGLAGLASLDLIVEPRVACLPEGHRLAGRSSLKVADVLAEPIIAAPASPGPWRDYWLLTEHRATAAPVVAEAGTFEAELHLVARGEGISITATSASRWYTRPGIVFIPIDDLEPCRVALAWRPEDTPLVAGLVSVATNLAGASDTDQPQLRPEPRAAD